MMFLNTSISIMPSVTLYQTYVCGRKRLLYITQCYSNPVYSGHVLAVLRHGSPPPALLKPLSSSSKWQKLQTLHIHTRAHAHTHTHTHVHTHTHTSLKQSPLYCIEPLIFSPPWVTILDRFCYAVSVQLLIIAEMVACVYYTENAIVWPIIVIPRNLLLQVVTHLDFLLND